MQYNESGKLGELFGLSLQNGSFIEISTISCANCKSEFFGNDIRSIRNCPVCSKAISPATLSRLQTLPRNTRIFKFNANKAEAIESYKKWIAKKVTAKSGFIKHAIENSNHPIQIFLPYWKITLKSNIDYRGKQGDKVHWVGDTKSTISWTETAGDFKNVHYWLFPATHSFPEVYLCELPPFNLEEVNSLSIPDSIQGIAGNPDKNPRDLLEKVRNKRREQIVDTVKKEIGGTYQKIEFIFNHVSSVNTELCLLPVYLTKIDFKNKTYTAFINGQTLEVQGDFAYSSVKEWLIISLVLAVIATIVYLFVAFG